MASNAISSPSIALNVIDMNVISALKFYCPRAHYELIEINTSNKKARVSNQMKR